MDNESKIATFHHTMTTSDTPLRKKIFKNIMGKGENADNQHFLHFLQSFLPHKNKMF